MLEAGPLHAVLFDLCEHGFAWVDNGRVAAQVRDAACPLVVEIEEPAPGAPCFLQLQVQGCGVPA